MRLLMTAWSFYPAQEGGPSNALYWLASGLAHAGYDMHVVTTNRFLPKDSVEIDQWVEINGFKVIYQSNWDDKSVIERELGECDVYFTDGVCKLSYFNQAKLALKKGKKVILSPRGEVFESAIDHKGKLFGCLKRLFLLLMRVSFGSKVIFHATSKEEVEAVKKYFGRKANIVLIPNYMILPEKVRQELINEERKYLLYVGRINHIKNLDMLISALAMSKKFMASDYVLKIAGETGGDYYDKLLGQIDDLGLNDKVRFLGLVTGKDKDVLYAGAKCLFLISKSENFGNVIVESLVQGTPIVASKGTPWQILEKEGAGCWINATPLEISESINRLLEASDSEYNAMRESAFRLSKEFDVYSNIEKWISVVE